MNKVINTITFFFVFYFCLSCITLATPQKTYTLYTSNYDEGYEDGYEDAEEEFENRQEEEKRERESFRSSIVGIISLVIVLGICFIDKW